MGRNGINAIVNELAKIQLELKQERETNQERFDLFRKELERLDKVDQQLNYRLDKAIDRIKELIKRINK